MKVLINHLSVLLKTNGFEFEDGEKIVAARLHSSNPDSSSFLTIVQQKDTTEDQYLLMWVYVNNYDLSAVIDGEVEDYAETLNQAQRLFDLFFRD
jgi:hypothetical protein